jgi:energy-coupling factor transporter transmembrane protein EcfT
VYNYTVKLSIPFFVSNLTKAAQDMRIVQSSANTLYTTIPHIMRDAHPYAFAALLILFIALIFMSLGFLFSNISFCCVIRTQERKFKILSNASWFSSSLSLIMIFVAGLALSFGGPVLSDFCRIQNNQMQEK